MAVELVPAVGDDRPKGVLLMSTPARCRGQALGLQIYYHEIDALIFSRCEIV